MEHAPHVAPAVPHEVVDCDPYGSHVPFGPPMQQPIGQDVASQAHTPDLHSWPCPQLVHFAPPVPHCEVLVAVTQC